jgi:hypothetical protein
MQNIKEKLCRLFKVKDEQRTQLWMKNELIKDEALL